MPLDPGMIQALMMATGMGGGAGGMSTPMGGGSPAGGGMMSWLGQLGSGLGSQGFGNALNGLYGLGGLLGGQNFDQGGLMGLFGGGGFGGFSGFEMPDEFTYTSDYDLSRRMRDFLKDFYGGYGDAPGQWQHELDMQGGQNQTLLQLQRMMNQLGMADIDLRRVLGLEGLGTQERLGMADIGSGERLGMQGYRTSEANTSAQMNALVQAMSSIFGGQPSGMTAAPAQGGGGSPMGGGGDMFSGIEGQLQGELSRPTTLNPADYAGIASRGNRVIDKQAQAGAQALNRNAQRSGLGFNPGMMNRQAQVGAEARGNFANNLADAEISDRMTTAARRPGYLGMLGDIAGRRQQGRQYNQNQALGMLPYFFNN